MLHKSGIRPICFYSISTHLGGAERSLLELVLGLQSRPELGYRPWVLLPKGDGPLVEALKRAGVDFEVLEMPAAILDLSRGTPIKTFLGLIHAVPALYRYLRKFQALIRSRDCALVHSNGLKCHLLSALSHQKIKRPVIWHVRDLFSGGAMLFVMKFFKKKRGIYLIANSEATAKPFCDGKKNPAVIYNGFDTRHYVSQPNRVFHEMAKVPASVPMVGVVGVLARWKGQLEFLRMAKLLLDSGLRAHFVVVGDEIYDTWSDRGYKKELLETISRLGLKERVLFAGFQKDSVRAMNGLDVLVHASTKPEPFGRVIVEAMACCVPVVCSAAGGVLEIIENGKTGLLYPPGEMEVAAESVRKILTDARLREALVRAASEKVHSDFGLEKQVERVVSFYDSVLSEPLYYP